jgi:NNMT/PNMT/TEMT family
MYSTSCAAEDVAVALGGYTASDFRTVFEETTVAPPGKVDERRASSKRTRANVEFDWDNFDPDHYVELNYQHVHDTDLFIIDELRDFFGSVGVSYGPPRLGIDVGCGANLYPALSMVPFCRQVTLSDVAKSNIDWVERQRPSFAKTWDPFWERLAKSEPYASTKDPRAEIRHKVDTRTGDLFDLPRARWDIGTMFFVAESISEQWFEFYRGTHRFVRALKPDAPFAAAFMESSAGYWVGGRPFPAVDIGQSDVETCLASIAHDVRIQRWPVDPEDRLRVGYSGMILALGRAGRG